MSDPLAAFIRPGFPKESATAQGYTTIVQYVGKKSELYGAIDLGKDWGGYFGKVEDLQGDPFEGSTERVVLTVRMLRKFGDEEEPGNAEGEEQETIYEIDWTNAQKNLIDHPIFTIGNSALGASDRIEIKYWEQMWDEDFKAAYKFYRGNIADWDGSTYEELSENAQKYAQGILLGIEYYVEKLPVLRESTTYRNGVPPDGSNVGKKDDPGVFPGKPGGYEYIKEADRSTNTGKQNEWRRDQEWLGVKKVLIDSEQIFY